MSDAGNTTAHIQAALALISVDPKKARDQLLARAHDRLERLASRALNGYRPLRDRGVQTGDIVQSLYVRLLTGWDKTVAGEDGLPVRDPAVFLRRVSFLLRKVLGDELRRFNGRPPESRRSAKGEEDQGNGAGDTPAAEVNGVDQVAGGANKPVDADAKPVGNRRPKTLSLNRPGEVHHGGHDPANDSLDPEKLALFTDFHRAVDDLADDLRAVVDLHYYQELTHAEVGELLGIAAVTSQRRWVKARLRLIERLGTNPFLDSEA